MSTGARYTALLADVGWRDSVKEELALRENGLTDLLTDENWDNIVLAEAPEGDSGSGLVGQSVATLASQQQKHPLDFMLDYSLDHDLTPVFFIRLLNSDIASAGQVIFPFYPFFVFFFSEDVCFSIARSPRSFCSAQQVISHPRMTIACSDAGAHLTFLCDADFGLQVLGPWVRDRQLFTMEQAVHELSGKPASIYGLLDRGTLAVGSHADLLLFGPETVGATDTVRVADLPAGASRLVKRPLGVVGTWVNGVRVVDSGEVVVGAARPGALMREFAAPGR